MTVTIIPGQGGGHSQPRRRPKAAGTGCSCAPLWPQERAGSDGIARSQDMLATMDCIRAMGGACRLEGETAGVTGTGGAVRPNGTLSLP